MSWIWRYGYVYYITHLCHLVEGIKLHIQRTVTSGTIVASCPSQTIHIYHIYKNNSWVLTFYSGDEKVHSFFLIGKYTELKKKMQINVWHFFSVTLSYEQLCASFLCGRTNKQRKYSVFSNRWYVIMIPQEEMAPKDTELKSILLFTTVGLLKPLQTANTLKSADFESVSTWTSHQILSWAAETECWIFVRYESS